MLKYRPMNRLVETEGSAQRSCCSAWERTPRQPWANRLRLFLNARAESTTILEYWPAAASVPDGYTPFISAITCRPAAAVRFQKRLYPCWKILPKPPEAVR